jgi:Cu/Ag efflux protein CusF
MTVSNKKKVEKTPGRIGFAGVALALLAMALPACSLSSGVSDSRFTQGRQERRYELKGVVKSVDRPNRSATIKHEKVGDYMGAMTMPFLIKDEKALKAMRPGDRIKATLVVTDDGGQWMENVAITSKAGAG